MVRNAVMVRFKDGACPPLSSLDTLQGVVLVCASVPKAKPFSPSMATSIFTETDNCAGSIEVTEASPNP